jgi:hypothetical protein
MSYQFATVDFFREGELIKTRSINCDQTWTNEDILNKILNRLSSEYIKIKYDNYTIKRVEL